MASMKTLFALAAGAALLAGCADYPYYGDGYNGYGYDRYGYDGYDYGPGYYDAPGYFVGPEIGFGIGFSDRDRHERRRDGREERGEEHHRDDRH